MGKSIFRASMFLILGTVLSKMLGIVREIVFVHQFGASTVSDAFLLTRSIPGIFFYSLGTTMNINFIPIYSGMNENEKEWFMSNLLNICLVLTSCGCLLINLFPEPVLYFFASSLSEETMYYSIPMLRIASISVIPILTGALFRAYSQVNGYFFSTALMGIVINIVTLVSYTIATEEYYWVLSIGLVASYMIVWVMMFVNARKAGFQYLKVLDFQDSHIFAMAKLTVPLTIGQLAEDASLLVDRNLATIIGTGVLSSMAYASLLANATSSIIISSLTIAAYPTFSRLIATGCRTEFSLEFRKYLLPLCYTLCPISVFTFLFADDIVMCILGHGALHSDAAKVIWECTACYALGLLPFGIQNYVTRGFFAFRETKLPTYIVLFSLVCNIGLSIWSAPRWGYIGIATSTSVSYFIAAALLVTLFARKYDMPVFQSLHSDLISSLVLAAVPAISVYWLFRIIGVTDSLLVRVVSESILFFVFYAVLLFVMHKDLFQQIVSVVRRKI